MWSKPSRTKTCSNLGLHDANLQLQAPSLYQTAMQASSVWSKQQQNTGTNARTHVTTAPPHQIP